MGAEAEADGTAAGAVEAGPLAHGGCLAVCPNEPAETDGLAVYESGVVAGLGLADRGELHAAIPEQADARGLGASGEKLMQVWAADAYACTEGKAGVNVVDGVFEADAVEEVPIAFVEGDAELGE